MGNGLNKVAIILVIIAGIFSMIIGASIIHISLSTMEAQAGIFSKLVAQVVGIVYILISLYFVVIGVVALVFIILYVKNGERKTATAVASIATVNPFGIVGGILILKINKI